MILPRYTIERVYLDSVTPGSMFPRSIRVEQDIVCKTLELPWRENNMSSDPTMASCVPEGIYLFRKEPPKAGRNYVYFRAVHVPARNWEPAFKASNILIHVANRVDQLLGCIAPGGRHADINNDGIIDVVDSTKKMLWLAANLPDYFELEIREKK